MADITKLVKAKPDEKKQVDIYNQLLSDYDKKLINEWNIGRKTRTMPQGIRKRYV